MSAASPNMYLMSDASPNAGTNPMHIISITSSHAVSQFQQKYLFRGSIVLCTNTMHQHHKDIIRILTIIFLISKLLVNEVLFDNCQIQHFAFYSSPAPTPSEPNYTYTEEDGMVFYNPSDGLELSADEKVFFAGNCPSGFNIE